MSACLLLPTDLFELLEFTDPLEHFAFRRFLDFATEYILVQHRVHLHTHKHHESGSYGGRVWRTPYLVEVEHDIQLAHIRELLVEQFDKQVDGLQAQQLVRRHIDTQNEEQTRVATVDDLVRAELDEIRVLRVAADDEAVDLGFQARLVLVIGRRHVPFRQAGLALTVLQ